MTAINSKSDSFDIKADEILEKQLVKTCFLPVVSIPEKTITGFEALSRGICPYTGKDISPFALFSIAKDDGVSIEMDRLCREKALENFRDLYVSNNNYLLFLNIETSILDEEVVGSGYLFNQVLRLGLNPNNIVIEILESESHNVEALKKFIDFHKEHGFIIALDDVGAGSSNLNRIALAKPDLIKIDKYIVEDMENRYHKQEIFRALVQLSRNIGALVVSEGVESEKDVLLSLELGGNLLQGFYFSKPVEAARLNIKAIKEKIDFLALKFKSYKKERIHLRRKQYDRYGNLIKEFIDALSLSCLNDFETTIKSVMKGREEIECAYILDERGIQSGRTIINNKKIKKQKRLLFHPADNGSDHSLKDYYLFLNSHGDKYVSSEYISMASGNLCITISTRFNDTDNFKYIICVDIVRENS